MISFDYVAFLVLIVLFPVVKGEYREWKYDFFGVVIYFSFGIILAALCAQRYATYGNISRYITVHSYATITRLCGFYGDPNFYTAQITAALGGGFYVILKENSKMRISVMGIMLMLLLYCGFLSGSKSFVLVTAVIVAVWAVELLKMRGKTGRKIIMIIAGVLAAMYIASSALFGDLIEVLLTRFSYANDMSSFTTRRTDIWQMYLEEIFKNWKILLIGKGFTNVNFNGKATHNTALQLMYQFGILGAPVLIAWCRCFYRGIPRTHRREKNMMLWMVICGAFIPWMAIDVMFFDEFFLLQWLFFVALQDNAMPQKQQDEHAIQKVHMRRVRRLRFT